MNSSQKLHLTLLQARLRHLNKHGAMSLMAMITLRAEDLDDPDLKQYFASLGEVLAQHNMVPKHYFCGLMLFSLVAEVEYYLAEIVQAIITAHPKKIGSMQIKLADLIDRPQSEIVGIAASKFMNDLMFKKPTEYLDGICDISGLNKNSLTALWLQFVEAKARRDLGIHNSWIVNDIYLRKLQEAGISTTLKIGDSACPDHDYILPTSNACEALIKEISTQVEAKYPSGDA